MLAAERHQQILKILEEQGTIRTIDLAEEFHVTDETIRRDLQVLAEASQLTRIHGGASSLSGRPKLKSFRERGVINTEKKKAIAQAAVELIQPGKTYAFDSSTTAFALVSILLDLPYRVITNAFAVLDHLIVYENVQLISTGGRYEFSTHTFVGSESVTALQRHRVNTAFVSCIGYDEERGASEGFEEQASYKEHLVKWADEVVLLIDSSKFDKCSEYFFADVNSVDTIITDRSITPGQMQAIRQKGIKLIIAD